MVDGPVKANFAQQSCLKIDTRQICAQPQLTESFTQTSEDKNGRMYGQEVLPLVYLL